MARGTWDDFTSKWGFSDGETWERKDERARTKIIEALNELPTFKKAKVRAVAFDRPGVHNSLLVVLLPNPDNRTDDELLKDWIDHKIQETDLPQGEGDDYDVGVIVDQAYDMVDRGAPVIQAVADALAERGNDPARIQSLIVEREDEIWNLFIGPMLDEIECQVFQDFDT